MDADGIFYQKKYDHLADKVRKMMAAQKAYFKSNKDIQLLKLSKAIEKEVDEIVNPKPVSQAQLDFLGR
ncbi:MAG TPA: hypothetical protein VF487_20375 [Chitinophagaceae bacterium]